MQFTLLATTVEDNPAAVSGYLGCENGDLVKGSQKPPPKAAD